MNKNFTNAALAAGLLTAFSISAAQAQSILLTAPPAGSAITLSNDYPLNNGFIQGPFTVGVGSNTATFTATGATSKTVHSFETFDNYDATLDFPVGSIEINTFDGGEGQVMGATGLPTGPLLINFGTGVSAFGVNVESARDDTATFSFTAYDGSSIIGTYTLAPVTQSEPSSNHHSIFLGAQALGTSQITSVMISDTSIATAQGFTDTSGTNDFYTGPISTYAPVPEASTTVSLGLLLLLGIGGAALSARRKTAASASTV